MKKVLCFFMIFVVMVHAHTLLQGKNSILINHLGYSPESAKIAVIKGEKSDVVSDFSVKEFPTEKVVLEGKVEAFGKVDNWKDWYFWQIDFTKVTQSGEYYLEAEVNDQLLQSYPFEIKEGILVEETLSDVLYYFKGQRSTGQFEKAEKNLPFKDHPEKKIDARGGWMDATGDYGKHLSHLTFSTYFNCQQVPLVAWSLLNSYEELVKWDNPYFHQYLERMLDEALYGADYLVRMHGEGSSFYRSVSGPGPEKAAEDRVIVPTMASYAIRKSKDSDVENRETGAKTNYAVSYRCGGGISIAALAMASQYEWSGEFSSEKYLEVAENVFAFLEENNEAYTNDGKNNLLDYYTALIAATELYQATNKDVYKKAADKYAGKILEAQVSDKNYKSYFTVNGTERPFFHPADEGMLAIALMQYSEIADKKMQVKVLKSVKQYMEYNLDITGEVSNPFNYARQYVQDTTGARYSSFFFPHNTETSPWWQGENARLGSVAAAAKLASRYFADDKEFQQKLNTYAISQLNWILGLNPYDTCMLDGNGHNNPNYLFFNSWEYTNAPGGICNGITAGFTDHHDIDFHLTYAQTGKDNDWRWGEQWIPHASWYLYAISIK